MKYTHKKYLLDDLRFLREMKSAMTDLTANSSDVVARESLENMIDHWLSELERETVE